MIIAIIFNNNYWNQSYNLTVVFGTKGILSKCRDEQSMIFAGMEQWQDSGHQNVSLDSKTGGNSIGSVKINLIISVHYLYKLYYFGSK